MPVADAPKRGGARRKYKRVAPRGDTKSDLPASPRAPAKERIPANTGGHIGGVATPLKTKLLPPPISVKDRLHQLARDMPHLPAQPIRSGVPHLEARPGMQEANARLRAAHEAVGTPAVTLPIYPKLAHYTATQREAIIKGTNDAIKKYRDTPVDGKPAPLDVKASRMLELSDFGKTADQQTRTAIHKLRGAEKNSLASTLLQREADPIVNPKQPMSTTPKVDHPHLGGRTQIAGLTLPGVHQLGWTTARILEQFARPLHATAGALRATQVGDESPLSAFGKGLANKEKYTYGDLPSVKNIPNPVVRTLTALGGDVVGDPLNLLTGEATIPADALRATASALRVRALEHGLGAAEKTKLLNKAADLEGRAQSASTNKGLRVGVRAPGGRGKLLTSGEGSAQLSKLLGVSQGSTALRNSLVGQGLGKALVPGFMPKGVDKAEWDAVVHGIEPGARATVRTGLRQAERLGVGYHKALRQAGRETGVEDASGRVISAMEGAPKAPLQAAEVRRILDKAGATDEEVRQVMAKLPKDTTADLPPQLGSIAGSAQDLFKDLGQKALDLNMLKGTRANYVPHKWPEQLTQHSLKRISEISKGRAGFAQARSIPGSIAEINASAVRDGLDPIFSTNLPRLVTHRVGEHFRAKGAQEFSVGVRNAGVARPVTYKELTHSWQAIQRGGDPVGNVRRGDGLFTFEGGKLKAIENQKGLVDPRAAQKLIKQGKQVFAMNSHIGNRYAKGFLKTDNTARNEIGRLFDRYTSSMKTLFTVANFPAYDLRNLTGDLFNAYLADTHAHDVVDAVRAMRWQVARHNHTENSLGMHELQTNKTIKIGKQRYSITELLGRAERSGGIQTGYIGGEKLDILRGVTPDGLVMPHEGAFEGAVTSKLRHPVESLRSVGQVREDMVRFATWLGAKRRGMTDAEASRWANMHHFDYSNLTPVEQSAMRRIFPFWTFMARNTRLQATRALTNPGKFANYQALVEEGGKASGLGPNWEHHLEDYQQRGAPIPIPVPGRKAPIMAYPGSPITDLARVGAVGHFLTSGDAKPLFDTTGMNVHPLIKNPLEYGLDYSTFFRGPIYRNAENPDARHWVPAPGWVQHLPDPAKKALGVAQRPDDTQGGKKVWTWPAKTDYLARQTPETNFAIGVSTPGTSSRNQSQTQAILSQLSGVKLANYDNPTLKQRALQHRLRQVQVEIKDMQDLHTDRSSQKKGAAYSHAYRKKLDEQKRITGALNKIKKTKGYRQPQGRPVTPGSGGGSGWGLGGGTSGW